MHAEALLERALEQAGVGRVVPALALTEQALAAAVDDDTRARSLLTKGFLLAESQSAADGLAVLDTAAALPGLTPATRARVEGNRGLVLHRLGRGDAVDALTRAVELLPDDDLPARGSAHLNRGSVLDERGDVPAARADYDAALALAVRSDDEQLAAMASANLSRLLLREGAVVEALHALERAAPQLARLSGVMAAKCLANRAEIHLVAGLLDRAAADLARASALLGEEEHVREQADTETALARVLAALGRTEEAADVGERARRRLVRLGSHRGAARARRAVLQARLDGMRAEAARAQASASAGPAAPAAPGAPPVPVPRRDTRGRMAALAREARGLAVELEQLGDPAEARRAALVAVAAHLERGDDTDLASDAVLRRALRLRPDDTTLDRLLLRELRARVAEAQGRRPRVSRELTAAVDELHRHAARLDTLELRVASSVHLQRVARHAVRRALAAGRPWTVLEQVERTRALSSSLPRALSATGSTGHAGPDDEAVAASRGPGVQSGDPDPGARGPARRLRDVLEVAVGADGCGVSIADVDGALLGVVVDARGARLVPLGDRAPVLALTRRVRADLDVLAGARVPAPLRAVVAASLRAGLAELSARLLAPLDLPEGDGPLAIAPPAALALVPWPSLPGLAGRALGVHARLGTGLVRQGGVGADAAGVVAVSGPGLPSAAEELGAVSRAWGPGVRLLPGASVGRVLAAADGARVLHVAAHGVHEVQSPLLSHLLLADGPLPGHRLHDLPCPPHHVVLSACELGCAEPRPGEERLGMTAALLAAGSASVVAGVAKVADEVSAEVARHHHEALAAGLPPAHALARALSRTGDAHGPAPFVCFGAAW